MSRRDQAGRRGEGQIDGFGMVRVPKVNWEQDAEWNRSSNVQDDALPARSSIWSSPVER